MAYNLCSSPSSILCDRNSLCSSLPSSQRSRPKSSILAYRPSSSPFQPKNSLLTSHVSLQEPVSEGIHEQNVMKDAEFEHQTGNPSSSSPKSSVWINPRSPRASQLRKKSYDSKYSSLLKLAEVLDSCNPEFDDVVGVLSGFDGKLFEQDAVVTLNNMKNPETARHALEYFLEKIKPSKEVILYNVTLKVFRKCKDLEKAEKLFDEMLERGVKPDKVTFSTVISCARLASLPDRAIEWFQKMTSFGCVPDDVTHSAMIDAYGRAGNVEMALSLYDRARSEKWRIDPITFSTLIRIHGIAGNYDGCLNVYEEMKAIAVKPNLVVYNTLLDAMGRARRPWQAKLIYKDLISNGFTPNFITYAALLRAYCRAHYGEDAIGVYREMKKKSMELNAILYNTVLSMCADVGYVKEAVEIFEDMKKSATGKPDSWTFSSMITIHSCGGNVSEAEAAFKEMMEAGFEPNLFVLTSLVQCYGKAQQTDNVVRTFNQVMELGLTPDDRFCGCFLSVMTLTPSDELHKLIDCICKANLKLGRVINILVQEDNVEEGLIKKETFELLDLIGSDVKKAYCNCLIDLCVNLNKLERASELLQLGLEREIYSNIHSKSATQWSLNVKSLSLGAALTALHLWVTELSKAFESGDELPPLLGINTGHGKHKYSDKGLAAVFESHLKTLDAPFHESPDKIGWFLTTKVAAKSWLESRKSPETVSA